MLLSDETKQDLHQYSTLISNRESGSQIAYVDQVCKFLWICFYTLTTYKPILDNSVFAALKIKFFFISILKLLTFLILSAKYYLLAYVMEIINGFFTNSLYTYRPSHRLKLRFLELQSLTAHFSKKRALVA